MKEEQIENVLKILARDKELQSEVSKNFSNNLWWPSNVEDKRLRLIIAGLSTRISYSMIESYIKVINNLISIGFDKFKEFSDDEKIEVIKSLGLSAIRLKYISSMYNFIDNHKDLNILEEDEFISLINKEVTGASYKVAQCCLLYYRGYPNSIMPVDSGMKDVLLPCLGYEKQKSGIGHEYARKKLEKEVAVIDKKKFINENGLNINENAFNWWAHLSLIYYKRKYCNKKNKQCPLHSDEVHIKEECLKG